MTGPHPWMKVIHATSCDAIAVEGLVAAGLALAPAVRVMDAPAHGDPLTYWKTVGLACEPQLQDGDWTPVRGESGAPLCSDRDRDAIILFYMERAARHGGELRLLDAESIAAFVREEDPILCDGLFGVDVAWDDGRRGPILHQAGDRLTLHWRPGHLAPGQSGVIEALCGAFCELLEDMEAFGRVPALRLQAGDALLLHADEVLLGFAPKGGERALWRAGLKRADGARRRAA